MDSSGEQQLQPAEESDLARRLRLLVAQLPAAFWAVSEELRFTDAVGQLEPLTGLPASALIGRLLTDGPMRADGDFLEAHRRALRGHTELLSYDTRGRSFDVRLEPLRGDGGAPTGVLGIALDVTPAQTARAQLRESKEQLALAQNLAHVGSWTWTVPENTVVWSDELYEIYGHERTRFGATYGAFLEMVVPEDRQRTTEVIARALRDKQPFDYDHRVRRQSDGEVRTLRTRGTVMFAPDGTVKGLTGACWDITDIEQRTAALQQTVRVLESTLQSSADGVLVVGSDGRIVAYNEPFLKIWRIPDEIAQTRDDGLLIEYARQQLEDPDGFARRVREVYNQPEDADSKVEALHFKDGRLIERRTRGFRLEGPQRGRVWTFRDVTEEQRLLFRAILLSDVSRLLATLDVEAALQTVVGSLVPRLAAGAACDLFDELGWRRVALASADGKDLPGCTLDAARPFEMKLSEANDAFCLQLPLASRGKLFGALVLISASRHTFDAPTIDLLREVAHRAALATENAKLYRDSGLAVRYREEFLSVVAHEIRGPLTAIHLATQALLRGGIPAEQTRRVLEMLQREDRRIAGFVDDLLELGRIQAGRFAIHFEQVNLSDVVREVADRLSQDATRAGSTLTLKLDDRVTGRWDRTRLDQVVTNLLTNAIKYGLGHPIEVELTSDKDRARLMVRDGGIGIPNERIPQLFRPFERAVSSRQYGGLGLGLFIVKTIVDQLGGSVQVTSARNEGSTFEVVLPKTKREQ